VLTRGRRRTRLQALCGPFFVLAGALHFVRPGVYASIVPDYLPAHRALVYASGVAEAAGGAGLLHPATRRLAGPWLAATLLAIFPANVWMAQHPERYRIPGGRATLVARLPVQAVLIAWVRSAARS
jgi:uncharacterized membrane protein